MPFDLANDGQLPRLIANCKTLVAGPHLSQYLYDILERTQWR
jgi:hypothetical protein